MKHLAFLLLAACAGMLVLAAGVGADDGPTEKTIFYNLTTDESWSAGMALGQAAMAREAGYRVVVFLNVRGVYLADRARAHDTFTGSDKTAPQAIADLVAEGAVVQICPMCMEKAGLEASDLIEGVAIGGAAATFPLMTGADTTVVSY